MSRFHIITRVPVWGLNLVAQASNALLAVYENNLDAIERDVLLAKRDVREAVLHPQVNPDESLQRPSAPGRAGPEDDMAPSVAPS